MGVHKVPIVIDEQTYSGALSGRHTVRELADEVCGPASSPDRRLVVAVSCDGQPITPERLEQVLQSPIEQFESLELQTVSVRDQVRLTLTQAREVLPQARLCCEEAADLLDQGRHESSMLQLQKLLEILKQVQYTTVLVAQLLGLDLDRLDADGRSLVETLDLIKDHLGRLKEGMENHDFVTVSDLLRYEFAEPLGAWSGLLQSLDAQATDR